MGKHLIAGLIGTRMKPQLGAGGLTCEIRQTSQLMSSLGFTDADEYTQALVNLSAEFLPLPEVIKQLSAQPHTVHRSRLLNNARVAAVYLNKASDLKSLRDHGAERVPPDSAFGEPLAVAACYANPELFFQIAYESLRTDDKMQRRLCSSRLLIALSSAANLDQRDVFCDELRALLDELEEPESDVYAIMLRSALLAGSTGVVTKLASWLKGEDSRKRYIQDDESWLEIVRLACVGDYREIVHAGCTYTSALDIDNANDLLLQDASMAGNLQLIHSLLKYPYTDLGRNTAIWWAARNSRWDIVEALEGLSFTLQNFLHALSGTFSQKKRRISMSLANKPEQPAYSDLVDMFLHVAEMRDPDFIARNSPHDGNSTQERPRDPEDMSPSQEDPFVRWFGPQRLALSESCLTGEISSFTLELSRISDAASLDEHVIRACFSSAITSSNVSLIHYLCAKFPRDRFLQTSLVASRESTAVFQVALDHGLQMGDHFVGLQDSPIGSVSDANAASITLNFCRAAMFSDRLTSWLLDQGADPNQRAYYDITLLSFAVQYAPLSVILLLLRRGGDVRKGQMLHSAVNRNAPDQLAIIDLLLARGAPINALEFENDAFSWKKCRDRDSALGTALHEAVMRSKVDAVRLLLDRGADRTLKDSKGRTAFSYAAERGNDTLARLVSLD